MRIAFEVGSSERHQVDFSWNQFWGTLRIFVDGVLVEKSGLTLMSRTTFSGDLQVPSGEKWKIGPLEVQLVERWSVYVGDTEKHHVVVEKQRERWAAGFRPQSYRVFVDGNLVKQCRGF